MAELDLQYKKDIAEAGLNQSELPSNIKKLINGVGLLMGKYTKTPNEVNEAAVEKADLKVCEALADYIESQENAKDEQKKRDEEAQEKAKKLEAENKAKAEAAAKKAEEDKKAADAAKAAEDAKKAEEAKHAEAEQQRIAEENGKPENQIRAKLVDNKIHEKDLKAILGKLNTWDGEEKVGSLKLVKMFASDYYRVA